MTAYRSIPNTASATLSSVLCALIVVVTPGMVQASSPNPDLTSPGAIAALKSDSDSYGQTYNLGATGLRGWIYIDDSTKGNATNGLLTDQSRQILVTVASTPASAVLAVDDVILGAMAASSGSVPMFAGDCRKAFGAAITDAEKTGAGTLRVKRWREGTPTIDVNIPMTIMGNYTATAPYDCPKSTAILAAARTQLVSELLADANFLSSGYDYAGAISGLALLAGVSPGDANYATVQSRLQSFAQSLAAETPDPTGFSVWHWAYRTLFLSEYYLSTGDASVLDGINTHTVVLAQGQGRYGTFGHGARVDGILHGSVPPYGPVNSAGIAANIGIVMGKKALVAGGQVIDPEIDPAIQRGSDFFASYVNRGSVPYGEHAPWMRHSSNGKNPMCAVLFGLQDNRPAETEYFTRMSIASYPGRESGHSGQAFNYLWQAMAANMAGPEAVARYLEKVRWHLDLSRRTNGSFVYDGRSEYGGGKTDDGTYLGDSGYYDLNPTAGYILSHALPLQRLHITGKTSNPAYVLDSGKVDNALAAATYNLDCTSHTTTELIAALREFDPLVRSSAAIELATRSLTGTEVNTLLAMVTDPDANARMGACEALGRLQNSSALPLLAERLSDPVPWVRAKAAEALRWYSPADASTQLTPMLTAFIANATDPEGVVWDDPIQLANNQLSFALFGDVIQGSQVNGGANLGSYTSNAPKSLLYPAIRAGLKQPHSLPRLGVGRFCRNHLNLDDVQELAPDLFELITTMSQASTMWGDEARAAGISTLAHFQAAEGIPMAFAAVQDGPNRLMQVPGLNALQTYGDAARWTLPALREMVATWDGRQTQYLDALYDTIDSIEAAISAPAGINNLVAVADPQVVTTTGSTPITLTGSSCRGDAVSFTLLSPPAHGTLSGTAPNLSYTPSPGYSGPDHFTFEVADTLTTSEPGTVSIIVGTAGTGLKGEYYNNADFTNLALTRTDPQVDFDWGSGSPHGSIGSDTFSVRWSGLLLVPASGTYHFSTLNSDGVRLYADGVAMVDDFTDQATNWEDGTALELTEGQVVDLHMLYYENTGSAVAKLKWTGPSLAGANGLPIATEWLSEGAGGLTPYAHAQSVTLVQNTSAAITLTGSGADPGALIYTVVTPPAHGSLSGSGPNVIYTPTSNYSGTDSFTFLVNNGTGNSTPATVSLAIWASLAGTPESYFWEDAVSGNWSGASSWVNASGGTVTPAATGQANYVLHFDQPGSYTTTQDLNDGFLFNEMNLSASLTLEGSNSLSPAGNGPVLPQINQESHSKVTLSVPLDLAEDTTFGGRGAGEVYLTGLVSGPGGLIKDSPSILRMKDNANSNSYGGGTVINSGTLRLDLPDGPFPTYSSILGTGPVTLNGGTLLLHRINATNALTLNGGKIDSQNGFGNKWFGPVTLNAETTVQCTSMMTIEGDITGPGGLIKTDSQELNLAGSNSYTGQTTVTDGTLSCRTAASLGTGPLDIEAGAIVDLDYAGTRSIAALTLGGTAQAPGTYGSSSSPATHKNDSWFSGTGTVSVTGGLGDLTPPTPAQMTWANPPAVISESAITMTAVTASDENGVQYYFTNTTWGDSSHDSGWQDSPEYTDTGLLPSTAYTYTVTARDQSANNNENLASAEASATTLADGGAGGAVIYEPFDQTPGDLSGQAAGSTGLSGNWAQTSPWDQPRVVSGSMSFGSLATSGNSLSGSNVANSQGRGFASASLGGSLSAAGLLDDGDQLWFSVLWEGTNNQNRTGHLMLVSEPGSYLQASSFRPLSANDNTTIDAFGFFIGGGGDNLQGRAVANGVQTTGSQGANMTLNTTHLIVGKITWGAATDTLDLYLPGTDLALPGSTYLSQSFNIDQSGLDHLSLGGNDQVLNMDEIRFGATYNDVIGADTSGDNTDPTPAQMSWASPPAAISESAITMTAVEASDENGVQYYFTCTAGGGNDSGWQDSPEYTDTGLLPSTAYTYTVTARDQSVNKNENLASAEASATTQATPDTNPPPVPTFITPLGPVTATEITVSANPVVDGEGSGVEYRFHNTTLATDSGWLASPTWTDSGLDPETTYSYTVQARDTSAGQNESAPSDPPAEATTNTPGPGDIVWSSPQDITTSLADVSTVGTMVQSYTGHSAGGDVLLAGSETFSEGAIPGASPSGSGEPGRGNTTSDANYNDFLSRVSYGFSTISLTGLTENTDYLVQIWINDTHPNVQPQTLDGAVTLDANLGQWVTGTFTTGATQTTQSISVTSAGNTFVNGLQLRVVADPGGGGSAFDTWADSNGLDGTAGKEDGPLDDPDGDGIGNLLEFVLLGDPLVANSATLPTVGPGAGSGWVYEYERSNLSAPPATTQVVEYGTDLENWIEVPIPLNSAGIVTITPGSPSDHVSVAIPDLGPTGFARLKVSE